MFPPSFLSVWPFYFHALLFNSISTGSWPVCCQRSSFLIFNLRPSYSKNTPQAGTYSQIIIIFGARFEWVWTFKCLYGHSALDIVGLLDIYPALKFNTLIMVIKLLMYVGLHDVYPAMEINFAFWIEVKMSAACNFVSLGEKHTWTIRQKREKKVKKRRK